MRFRSKSILCQLVLICLVTTPAPAQEQSPLKRNAPLSVEAAASALTFIAGEKSPVDISPDGRWVAYVLRNPRLKEPRTKRNDESELTPTGLESAIFWGCDVWITNTRSRESKNLTQGQGTSWAPRWSPDGKHLAFYSDRNGQAHLWTWNARSGNLRQVSGAIIRTWDETAVWTPDSKSIITKVLSRGLNHEPMEASPTPKGRKTEDQQTQLPTSARVLIYSSPSSENKSASAEANAKRMELPVSLNNSRGELALIDVSSGSVKILTKGVLANLYSLSPTGTHLVASVPKRRRAPDAHEYLYDLLLVSLTDHRSEIISEYSPGAPSLRLGWSADGTQLSYVSDGELFIYSIGGKVRKASNTSQLRFTSVPVWDPAAQYIYVLGSNSLWKIEAANGSTTRVIQDSERQIVGLVRPGEATPRNLYVGMRNSQSKQQGFYKVNLTSGEVSKVVEDNKIYNLSLTATSPDGRQMIFGAQDDQHDENLWITDSSFRDSTQLTRINSDFERMVMGKSRLIEYQSDDGKKLQGALLLPADYQEGKRYPLIVKVYGGVMLSSYVNQFGFTVGGDQMQLFATRGYAVLMPDTPLRVGTPMQDLARTVLPAVDKVIELGIADPQRLGIMGHSYGGYSTLSLIVQTTRFKAAHSEAGLGNLIGKYGRLMKNGGTDGLGWAEEGQGRMGGTPWEFRDRYIQNSPVFFLDKVQTPLFIAHGEFDVTNFLSEEIFVGLRRLGKEVVYAKYQGEGHGIEGYANKVDYWNRLIRWFDSHLKYPTNPLSRHLGRTQSRAAVLRDRR